MVEDAYDAGVKWECGEWNENHYKLEQNNPDKETFINNLFKQEVK